MTEFQAEKLCGRRRPCRERRLTSALTNRIPLCRPALPQSHSGFPISHSHHPDTTPHLANHFELQSVGKSTYAINFAFVTIAGLCGSVSSQLPAALACFGCSGHAPARDDPAAA